MLHTKEATKCTIRKHSNKEMECRNIHVINAFFVITYYLCTKQRVVTAVFCWCQHKKQLHLLRLNFLSTLTSCCLPFQSLHTNTG